jgi:hypothetical protein
MANNLFVSYDLMKADKNYEAVITAIQGISGMWAKVHYSLWFVKSDLTASQVAQKVWAVMDSNDRLLVIDASNRTAAWYNLDKQVEAYIQEKWNQ